MQSLEYIIDNRRQNRRIGILGPLKRLAVNSVLLTTFYFIHYTL